jgi:hypothetical protein
VVGIIGSTRSGDELRRKGFSLIETIIFIVLAAMVIPIFYVTTQPMIKQMMTPTSYIKARFLAERKMEELMSCTYSDSALNVTPSPASMVYTDYPGYTVQWAITYMGCGAGGASCVNYVTSPGTLGTTSTSTNYKEIDVTISAPQNVSYRTSSAVTSRY